MSSVHCWNHFGLSFYVHPYWTRFRIPRLEGSSHHCTKILISELEDHRNGKIAWAARSGQNWDRFGNEEFSNRNHWRNHRFLQIADLTRRRIKNLCRCRFYQVQSTSRFRVILPQISLTDLIPLFSAERIRLMKNRIYDNLSFILTNMSILTSALGL